MKKSGKWFAFDFKLEEKKSLKTGLKEPQKDGTRKCKNNAPLVASKRSFNFQHHLKPKTVTDLAVHPKKIKEVEFWLQNNVINNIPKRQTAAFLLITGPTGSGKTITVQVLCQSMSINISEWVNPMDQDYEICRGTNQILRFSEFLTESKWNSLIASNDKKIILVEEFPNSLIRNPEEFTTVLEECYYKGNYPIVFICTDSFDSGSNLLQTLFPQEVRDKYNIAHISFNCCATTLMKSALRRAHSLIQQNLDIYKIPSVNTVDAIISTSMGDIRCAINQYYFASLLGTADLPTITNKGIKKSGSKRKRNESSSTVNLMSRDENLGLFHGLGRVLNPKRTEVGDSWRLNCDIPKLIDEFSTQPGNFTSFLFENYIKYFGDINDTCRAAEILSLSHTFLVKWVDRQDTLIFALWISVLGLMVYNEHKVSKWNQIKGPRRAKQKINSDISVRNFSATDLFYYNIISKAEQSQFNVNA